LKEKQRPTSNFVPIKATIAFSSDSPRCLDNGNSIHQMPDLKMQLGDNIEASKNMRRTNLPWVIIEYVFLGNAFRNLE
jgi:hypothetical protein